MKTKVLNLTKDKITLQLKNIGVVDLDNKRLVIDILNSITRENEKESASKLASLAQKAGVQNAIIGGDFTSSFFEKLELALFAVKVTPFYKRKVSGQLYIIQSPLKKELV